MLSPSVLPMQSAFDLLDQLQEGKRRNLIEGGHDPSKAAVKRDEWYQLVCKKHWLGINQMRDLEYHLKKMQKIETIGRDYIITRHD